MNLRMQKYKANRIAGMSAYKSAVEAGYSHNTAINAHRNIERRCNFDDLLIKAGLDNDYLLETLKQGCDVRNQLSGEPNLITKAFLEIAFKLGGKLKEKQESSGVNVQNFVIVRADATNESRL